MTASPEFSVRPERTEDALAIHELNFAAFGGPDEARIVDALRAGGALTLSLVAVSADGGVCGHVAFSPVTVEPPRQGVDDVFGLAPMAVQPSHQGPGVGAALVTAGLGALRAAGAGAVVVLGHPHYYPRFGFVPAERFDVRWTQPVPDGAFMAVELRPGALRVGPGVVRYRPELEPPPSPVVQVLEGGCHCGAVRFRVHVRRFEALDCNCSICRQKGLRHLIVPPEDFELLQGAEALSTYRFGTQVARHTFCATCGSQPFYRPRSHPGHVDVNVRCLDGDATARFAVRPFDGQNWDASVATIRG